MKFLICSLFMTSWAVAKIPCSDISGLLEATKPEYRHYSPFWGFVALEGGMLKAFRFYGNYTLSTDSQDRQIDVAALNDPIAQLIQNLFPSPDGVSFLPNTWSKEPGGFLSRHLESVNEIINILISGEGDKKSRILEVLRPRKQKKLIYSEGINKIAAVKAENFADNLLAAYDYCPQGQDIPYPQHTAITVLNAFFISVTDKVKDLEKLTTLMKNGFAASEDLKPFTEQDFRHYCPQINEIMAKADQQPELVFMMGYGQNHFNKPALSKDILDYRDGVKVTLANGETATFADCGETSVRNFFWKLSHLSPLTLPQFFNTVEASNPTITSIIPYQKLKAFTLDEGLLGQTAAEAHDKWAQMISGLNDSALTFSFDDVAYGQSSFYEIDGCFQPNKKILGGILIG